MGSSLTDICYPNIEKESATTIDRLELPQRTACRNKRNSLKHDIGKECQLASDPAKKNLKKRRSPELAFFQLRECQYNQLQFRLDSTCSLQFISRENEKMYLEIDFFPKRMMASPIDDEVRRKKKKRKSNDVQVTRCGFRHYQQITRQSEAASANVVCTHYVNVEKKITGTFIIHGYLFIRFMWASLD